MYGWNTLSKKKKKKTWKTDLVRGSSVLRGSPALNVHQTCQCVWTWCWPSALTASRSRLEDDQLRATTTTKHHQMSKGHHLSSFIPSSGVSDACSRKKLLKARTICCCYKLCPAKPFTKNTQSFFFFFFRLPSTVLLLSTNSVSLGIVWSIWQKCGGPQSETDNVISNWMSQSLVSSGRLRWPELQCESCRRRHLCGPSINISMTFYFWQKALVT